MWRRQGRVCRRPLWSRAAEDVSEPTDAFDAAVGAYDRFLSEHKVERTFHRRLLRLSAQDATGAVDLRLTEADECSFRGHAARENISALRFCNACGRWHIAAIQRLACDRELRALVGPAAITPICRSTSRTTKSIVHCPDATPRADAVSPVTVTAEC